MSIKIEPCRSCKRRGGLRVVPEFGEGEEKIAGIFCSKCSMFFMDPVSKRKDLSCNICKKPMGTISVTPEVRLGKQVLQNAVRQEPIHCGKCSEKRVKSDTFDPECLTRYEVPCSGGCGKIQGFLDVTEGSPMPTLDEIGSCQECEPKMAEIERNKRKLAAEITKATQ